MPKVLSVSIGADLNVGPEKFFHAIMEAINPIVKKMEKELISYMELDGI